MRALALGLWAGAIGFLSGAIGLHLYGEAAQSRTFATLALFAGVVAFFADQMRKRTVIALMADRDGLIAYTLGLFRPREHRLPFLALELEEHRGMRGATAVALRPPGAMVPFLIDTTHAPLDLAALASVAPGKGKKKAP
ncbi:MAG: hypothetical protein RMK90_10705 [Acetobacteraceae bacterium]|nr:hypothetical protein [Acetobacteraceae bacterium]